jgi:Fe-S cluster assembly protein SufD
MRERILASHARVAPALPGHRVPWVERLRRDGLDAFAASGLPTDRDEAWKYTRLAPLERQAFVPAPPVQDGSMAVAAAVLRATAVPGLDAHRLVFVDGRHVPMLSAPGAVPAGVTLDSLAAVLARDPDVLQPWLAQRERETVFGRLNAAFMTDGAWLRVARDAGTTTPIELVFVATAAGAALNLRNVIVAEAGARVTLVERYVGQPGAGSFTNALTQVFAADAASINHCRIQQEADDSVHIGAVHVLQQAHSRLASHVISLGARLARTDLTTAFAGAHCHASLDGLYVAGGRQHVDHHTRIDHATPHGTSREHYRGVLDGRARGVFTGQVVVHPGAQKTDAAQLNHNLLLSEAAEADTRPQLEIHADDVRCTHGATVGQLDDDQLFYLRTRGIDTPIARALLTFAFARAVVDSIGLAPLREHLTRRLLERLPEGHRIGEAA